MLSFIVRKEARARWRKGQPAMNTTGVESASCAQMEAGGASRIGLPMMWLPISSTTTGSVSASASQNRRCMSISS
jgi:hypothetical protein